MNVFAEKPRRAVMLASYRSPPTDVISNGCNIDLLEYRQKVAVNLLEFEFCDIYGRGWPPVQGLREIAGKAIGGSQNVISSALRHQYCVRKYNHTPLCDREIVGCNPERLSSSLSRERTTRFMKYFQNKAS